MLELNKIHCGDNCDLMSQLPRDCIDLVVTSPPYDDLRMYGGHSWDFYGVAWQLKRALKPGGVIVWVVADATIDGSETGSSLQQALHFRQIGLNLHDTMIWDKGEFSAVGSTAVRYGPSTEYMFVFSKGKPKTFNPIKDRKNKHLNTRVASPVRLQDGTMRSQSHRMRNAPDDMGIRLNVWKMAGEKSNTERVHPAQFPLRLAADHITSWSNPGDLVLDPFSGSGTTARAAKDLGRNFIGIEINPEYCAIAEERIAQMALAV